MTENTTKAELLPCPDGHKTVDCREWPAHSDRWHWFVRCTCCGWQGPSGATKAEAIAAWNTRDTPTEGSDLADELEAALCAPTWAKALEHVHNAIALRLSPPAPGKGEEIGICIGCNQPLRVGEVVTPWDDEIGHYDCKAPFSLARQPELDADPDCPEPMVLIGSPARYVPLATLSPDQTGLLAEAQGEVERDIRIAIWNAAMSGGMGQDLSQALIRRAMAEPTMKRALDAIRTGRE